MGCMLWAGSPRIRWDFWKKERETKSMEVTSKVEVVMRRSQPGVLSLVL